MALSGPTLLLNPLDAACSTSFLTPPAVLTQLPCFLLDTYSWASGTLQCPVCSNLSGQPLQPLCGPSFSTCPLCAQVPCSLGRLGTVGFRDHLYTDCSQIPLSTSHLTPRSTHFSNCLLNIPLILSPDTQTHHCKKEFGVTFSSRPAWSWVSPFAPGHSHPHSKQLRQQPSRYPGISLPLLSPICVTSLPFSQLLPNNVHVHHLFPEHLEPFPNWSSASSLPFYPVLHKQ